MIHESPIQVRLYKNEEHPFEIGQFFSDEPGYYQPGSFGIRLETVLRVVEKTGLRLQDKDDYGTFLGFEPVCLVPFEPKLIDYDLMNEEQAMWLNKYNKMIRDKVGPELKKQNKERFATNILLLRIITCMRNTLPSFSLPLFQVLLKYFSSYPVIIFKLSKVLLEVVELLGTTYKNYIEV